jgi:hypothetical protein
VRYPAQREIITFTFTKKTTNPASMFAELIKTKFPHDERAGLYKAPNLPAVKLGKVLMKDTRIASPNDVLAMYIVESAFSRSAVVFTDTRCFHDEGEFLLEDVKEAQVDGSRLTVWVNQKGSLLEHKIKTGSDQVAKSLQKLFQDIAYHDPVAAAAVENAYEEFDGAELDWLKLRDEVMRTIDFLYDRFNDGKLSLLEYEEKKQELLDRL